MTKAEERDPNLVFRIKVADVAMHEDGIGLPPGELRPQMATLRIVHDYIDTKIATALYVEKNPMKALRALADLRVVLSDLVAVGRKDFERLLVITDDALDGVAKLAKHHLVKAYLDPATPPERVQELHAGLLELAENGYWPRLLEDLDEEVWASVEERLNRQGDIHPWDWAC
jgi:hypothetical protein